MSAHYPMSLREHEKAIANTNFYGGYILGWVSALGVIVIAWAVLGWLDARPGDSGAAEPEERAAYVPTDAAIPQRQN